jgi:hypothetical protein
MNWKWHSKFVHKLISLSEAVGAQACNAFLGNSVRTISVYAKAEVCQLRLETQEIIPLSRLAVQSRLDRAESLLSDALRSRLKIYEPLVVCGGEILRVVFPPIVEIWQSGIYLVDGIHRVLAVIKIEQTRKIDVLGVRSEHLPPLPCDPSRWDDIRVSDEQKHLEDIFSSLKRPLFRPVSKHLNSERFLFSSFQNLLDQIGGESNTDPDHAKRI